MSTGSRLRKTLAARKRKRPQITIMVKEPPRRAAGLFPLLLLLLLATLTLGANWIAAHRGSNPTNKSVALLAAPFVTSASAIANDEIWPPEHRIPAGRPLRLSGRGKQRRGSRRNKELDRERAERRRRTNAEIDEIHAAYWKAAGEQQSWPVGTAYARFSTRFQESVADQIRAILDYALAHKIRIPRHLIFFDLAVRGVKNRREGLDQVRLMLRSRKATVLLLFSTNRLFRKTYLTLQFVDTVYRELRARCIFTMSGIDTANRDQWESLLHLHALMDQFVVRSGVAHIHASHEGMLAKRLVFGTLPFGYGGVPIPGQLTKLGKPRREIVIDEATAAIVRQIFRWYVEDRLDVIEILRRLNADSSISLPPKAASGRWQRIAVRGILKNARYRGLWQYGATESVFLPEKDYVRQQPRIAPLKEELIEELRIVDDALWYAAQERLAADRGNGGRPPVDGDHVSRPKLLNGLLVCPEHEDQVLHVGGPHGNAMVCPLCRAMPAAERPLYTVLNRRLAAELLIGKMVELLSGDAALIERSIAVCREAAESAQRPDPQAAARMRQELSQLDRAINLTRRTVGDTEEEAAAAERTIRDMQAESAGIRSELANLEATDRSTPRIPTNEEVVALLNEITARLTAAVASDESEVVAPARRILELLTDGRIALEQQGLREPKRGWLRGRFQVRLLSYLVEQCGGAAIAQDGMEVTIDFRRPSPLDARADEAWALREQGLLNVEIGERIGFGKSMVTKLLKHAAAMRGVPFQDGRRRRGELGRKNRMPPLYVRIAPEVGQLVEQGLLLAEIGERLQIDRTTLTKAYNQYRADQGLPPLDGRARRKLLAYKNRPRRDD